MKTLHEATIKFAEMIGWDGSDFTKPDEAVYEKLGAEFLKAFPSALSVIMPRGFDSVDEYVEHIKSGGRSVEYHVASKLIVCYE